MSSIQEKIITTFADSFNQGLIYVREDGTIGAYSTLAKKIIGIILPEGKSHPAGCICDGDIVIVADDELGNDDLTSLSDLKYLNIVDADIKAGDAILAVGVYGNKKIKPVYKFFREHIPGAKLELKTQYLGFNITVSIDRDMRRMSVVINGEKYAMDYIENIGYLVVLDGENGHVKFFQDKGYGYRGEELGPLLKGKAFIGKNIPGQPRDIHPTVGLPAEEILEGKEVFETINDLMQCENGEIKEGTFEIFRRMLFCHIVRVKLGHENDGVYLYIQDKQLADKNQSSSSKLNAEIEKREKRASSIFNEIAKDELQDFIGQSNAMSKVKNLAVKASKTKFNVIITGESGTGKSRLAREIHNLNNPHSPFVAVSCNAIAPSLFESELFGYEPGAFTGADPKGKKGFFEEANGGTIFLDEISEIPLEIQVKLLNVLQDRKIYRVGSTKPVDIDVRVITASNRDLPKEVLENRFRQDLFYRINVFPINIPPLRERRRDLYLLANSILTDRCKNYGISPKQFSEEAIDAITNYSWPGNVRELENIIERAIVICDGNIIYSEHLIIPEGANVEKNGSLKKRLENKEKKIIEEVLSECDGNKKMAQEELKLSRSVFYEKLKKYDLL